MIDNLLASTYPELCIRVTNAGISANNTRHILERLERDCIALDPDWVSICIGVNDLRLQFEAPAFTEMMIDLCEYEQNLSEIIERCRAKSTVKGIFLLSPFYIEPNREEPMRRCMDEYVAVCARLAEKYHCIYIDFQKLFEDYCQVRHPVFIAADRIHPNQIGATLMAKAFLRRCGFEFDREITSR